MQNYGGGRDRLFIRKLGDFVTAVVSDSRRLPSKFWAALAKLTFEADAMCPFVIWSIVKTEAKTPDGTVSGGVITASPATLHRLQTKVRNR